MQRRKTPHVESSRNVELTDLVTTRKQINGVKGREAVIAGYCERMTAVRT
jgi:hypothetical protein